MPVVLINGADGIGTGWSTSIPNFNPRDIIANLLRMLNGEVLLEMTPWYKGFNGTIVEVGGWLGGRLGLLGGCGKYRGCKYGGGPSWRIASPAPGARPLLCCCCHLHCLLKLLLARCKLLPIDCSLARC